jgi:GNAT superfamily N-acetyltransferase
MDNSPNFTIRIGEPRDAEAIATVHLEARRAAMPYLPEIHSDAETYAWVAEQVLTQQEVWVAEVDGRVVGAAALAGESLAQLYVLPGYQGIGIGGALFAKAQELRPAGFTFYVFLRNARARAFYERRGCAAIAFGDGSDNEEGEPDVLYRWEPSDRSMMPPDNGARRRAAAERK